MGMGIFLLEAHSEKGQELYAAHISQVVDGKAGTGPLSSQEAPAKP